MIGFLGKPVQNKTYSELFDDVCEKNCFYRQDLETMFSGHNQMNSDHTRFNLEELTPYDNPSYAYKRLVLCLRKWNEQVGKLDRKTTNAELSVYQFVYSSLKTLAFEAKGVRQQNIENLEKWFLKTTTIRKKKQLQTPTRMRPQEPEQTPIISAETSIRIKEYSRRLLQAHTGILRRKKKDTEEQTSEDAKINNIANRILINNLKEYRQNHENKQLQRKIQELHKHKQRLFQSLVSKKDYVQPDNDTLAKEVWESNQTPNTDMEFSNALAGTPKNQPEKVNFPIMVIEDNFCVDQSVHSRKQSADNFDFKPKFTAVQRANDPIPHRQTLLRVRTADPRRIGKENDASRVLLKKRSYNHRFEQIESIKNKFHSSKTVSHQKLFQGLNEPFVSDKIPCRLPQPGFSLLINPFFNKKQKGLKSSKKI